MYEEDDEEEEEQKLPVFRITMTRNIVTYVDVRAESMEDAMDMCEVGIAVTEDGDLDARSDMKEFVEHYEATRCEDEIITDSCEEVTDQYD